MGSMFQNFLLDPSIIPQANNSFWGMVGSFFVNAGAWLLYILSNIVYAICKFALNIIDFMQLLVEKLAGLEAWMHLEKLDLNDLKENDVVFRFLLSDTVLKVFRTLFAVFIVLLIFFTIVAIIKNEYGNVTASEKDAVDHKKSIGTALKAIATVLLVPFVLIVGIITSNSILASILKAFNVGDNVTIGSQLFVASSYDANMYRLYASEGERKAVSNVVKFVGYDANGELLEDEYTVNTAIPTVVPSDYDAFYGYMFTFDGDEYFIWDIGEELDYDKNHSNSAYKDDSTDKSTLRVKYYNYIKYVLGAYIVEENPNLYMGISGTKSAAVKQYYSDNYLNKQIDNDIVTKVTDKYNSYHLSYGMNENGYINGYPMYKTNAGEFLLTCAYNTWGYNDTLNRTLKNWSSQQNSLIATEDVVVNGHGTPVSAVRYLNNDDWGRLHDGGKYGFAPISQEYEVMADVMDFMVQNNVEIHFVNSNNPNISWNAGGYNEEGVIDISTLTYDSSTSGVNGFLVYYKSVDKPVSYHINYTATSEIEGAVYIACIYDSVTCQYKPLVNDAKVYDQKGNSYQFHSGKLSSTYHGVIVAHAVFDESNTGKVTPMYLSQSSASNGSTQNTNTTNLTNVQTKIIGTTYSFLNQKTTAVKDDVTITSNASDRTLLVDANEHKAVYFDTRSIPEMMAAPGDDNIKAIISNSVKDNFMSDGYTYKDCIVDESNYNITLLFEENESQRTGYNYFAITFELVSDDIEREDLHAYTFEMSDFYLYNDYAPVIRGQNDELAEGAIILNNGKIEYYVADSTTENDIYNAENAVNTEFIDKIISNFLKNSQNDEISYQKTTNYTAVTTSESDKEIVIHVWGKNGDSVETGAGLYEITLHIDSFSVKNLDGTSYGVYTISSVISRDPSTAQYPKMYSGYTGYSSSEKVLYLNGNLYVFDDGSALDEFERKAQATTDNIIETLGSLFDETYYNSNLYVNSPISVSGYGRNYAASTIIKVNKTDDDSSEFFKMNLSLYRNGDAQNTLTENESGNILMYKIGYSYSIYNTYDLYYSAKYNELVTEDCLIQNITMADLTYKGTHNYKLYDAENQVTGSKQVYQYTYNNASIKIDENNSVSGKLVLNAIATDLACDEGKNFVGYEKGAIKDINSTGATYPVTLMPSYNTIRTVYVNGWTYYAGDNVDTLYIADADNATENSVSVYQVNIGDSGIVGNPSNFGNTGGYTGDNLETYVKDRLKFETHIVEIEEWEGYSKEERLYYKSVDTISGKTLSFSASDVYDPTASDRTLRNDEAAAIFVSKMASFNNSYSKINYVDSVSKVEERATVLAKNPITIDFCRDEIQNQWISADIKLGLTWDPGFSFGWRFHMAARNYQNKNVKISDNKTVIVHNKVLTLAYGKLLKDYSFSGEGVQLGNVYRIMNFNWLILIFSIVLVISVLGTSVWGLIKRIYQITLLFLMMPPIAATLPLGKGNRFEEWKKKIIPEVLGAYGVTIALNFVFMLFPVIRQASAIFTDKDVESLTGAVKWFAHDADRLNWITYILFMLVAFTLFKTLPKFISDIIGGNDVFTEGGNTRKAVASTVDDVRKNVSGQAAKDKFNNFKKYMVGDGKTPGGLLTPGYAIGKDIYDKYKAKREKKKGDDESKVKADAENRANADAEAKMNAGENILNPQEAPKETTPQNNEALAKSVSEATTDNIQDIMAQDNKYGKAAKEAFEQAKADGYDEKQANDIALGVAQMEANKDLEAIANGTLEKTAENVATAATPNAENAANAEHAAVADKLAENNKESENAAKQYAEAAKSFAESSKTYAKIAGGKLDEYKRDISEINKDEKVAKAQQKVEEARADGSRALRLSSRDIDKWNAEHQDRQIARRGEEGYGSEDQKRLRLAARMEKKLNSLENNVIDAQNGIKHGVGASIKRKLVGGTKTENQRQKEAEKAKEAREQLDAKIENELTKNAEKDYKKAVKKANKKNEEGKDTNIAVQEELQTIQQKRAKSLTKDVEKLEKKAMDDKKGALLKTGRAIATAGKGVAIAGSKVASGLRNSGLGELTLGASEKSKEAAKALLAKRAELAKDVDNRQKELNALQQERNEAQRKVDQANMISELRKLNGQIDSPKLGGRDKGKVRKQMLELIENSNKNELFKGTKYEQEFNNVKNQKNAETFVKKLNEDAKVYGKTKGSEFDLTKRQNDLKAIERKLNGDRIGTSKADALKQAEKALQEFEAKHTEKEFERARRITDTNNNDARRIGLARTIKRGIAGTQGDAQAEAWNKLLFDQLGNAKNFTIKGAKKIGVGIAKTGRVAAGVATLGLSELAGRGAVALGKGAYKAGKKVGNATVGRYKAWRGNVAAAREDVQARYKESAAVRNARRKENESYIGELLLKREDATAKAMVKKLRDSIKAGKFKGDSTDAYKLAQKYMDSRYNKNVELTEDERARLAKYIGKTAAVRNTVHNTASKRMANQSDKVVSSLDRRHDAEIRALKREISSLHREVDRAIDARSKDSKNVNSPELQRYIKEELRKELKRRQTEYSNASGEAKNKLLREINSMKDILAKVNRVNSSYKRDVKRLQEADKKMSKQLKNSKSKNALAQATKTSNSFGEGASGKD